MKILSGKNLVLVIMSCFAVGSFSNVQTFFYVAHPNLFMSISLGIALGLCLIVMAHNLHEMNMKSKEFYIALAITVSLAILSGTIQSIGYTGYLAFPLNWITGFSLPVLGELGLSIFYSLYVQDKKKKEQEEIAKAKDVETIIRMRNLEVQLEMARLYNGNAVKATMENAMERIALVDANFLVEKKEMEMEKKRQDFAREIGVSLEQTNGNGNGNAMEMEADEAQWQLLEQLPKEIEVETPVAQAMVTRDDFRNKEIAQETETDVSLDERQLAIMEIIAQAIAISTKDIKEKATAMFDVSEKTISNDLRQLRELGKLQNPNRGEWALV